MTNNCFAAPRAALLAGLCALALAVGCANSMTDTSGGTVPAKGSANSIMVGEYESMTGAQSTFGASTHNGCLLAINELNKAGGVNGHPLTLDLQDDEGKPDAALTVVKKMITQDKVVAVIGEVASKNSIAAAPFCNSSHVPMISPSSTNPKVTLGRPYVFRVCFIDPFQGTAAAKFAFNTLHAKKAATLTDATGDYSIGLSQAFSSAFTKLGGTIVSAQNYQGTDADFRSQLTSIKAAAPDILFVPGYYNNVGVIAKQAREVGITVPLMGGDGWESDKLVEGAGGPGGALEGCYYTNHSSMKNPDPVIQNFVNVYKATYGSAKEPGALSALGYDSIKLLADGMTRAGAPADGNYNSDAYRAKLRDALAATKGFAGVTGKITLDANRDAIKPAVVLQVKGADDDNYVATVNP